MLRLNTSTCTCLVLGLCISPDVSLEAFSLQTVTPELATVAHEAGCNGNRLELIRCLFEAYRSDKQVNQIGQRDMQAMGNAATYGELLPGGVDTILARVEASGAPIGAEDFFCDLGSGRGFQAAQVHLTTSIGRVLGIEFSETRHAAALEVKDRIVAALASASPVNLSASRTLDFVQGDLRDGERWADARLCLPTRSYFKRV